MRNGRLDSNSREYKFTWCLIHLIEISVGRQKNNSSSAIKQE
jgi:hypothetical protein